ncbi:MAG: hypothetical protein HKO77_02730 [Gemmatimonadetes bacterium]|nr:hypothetical protein [Gemmatimonadota bacterium]
MTIETSKNRAALFAENIGESSAACLVAMVQGNILAVTAAHWAIALQTGLLAGTAATIVVGFMRSSGRLRIALVLAVVTGVVDYFVHPGMIGPGATEAILTGLGAGLLSLAAGAIFSRFRRTTSGPVD